MGRFITLLLTAVLTISNAVAQDTIKFWGIYLGSSVDTVKSEMSKKGAEVVVSRQLSESSQMIIYKGCPRFAGEEVGIAAFIFIDGDLACGNIAFNKVSNIKSLRSQKNWIYQMLSNKYGKIESVTSYIGSVEMEDYGVMGEGWGIALISNEYTEESVPMYGNTIIYFDKARFSKYQEGRLGDL